MKNSDINIYQIIINKIIDNTIQTYIFEINTNNNSKRYFYCNLNLKTGKYNLYKIASIGTLIEYLDKNGINVEKINNDNEKLLSLLLKYNPVLRGKKLIDYIFSSVKLYNKNEYNYKTIDIKNNDSEINSHIQLYNRLNNIKLNSNVGLFQKPTDIDMTYILNQKNKGNKK